MLPGLMMDTPLLITSIMRFADANHEHRQIVSVNGDGSVYRYTYGDAFRRARQLANRLRRHGCRAGDRIATLAWNDHRHFELYYGVSCSGLVCHTVNPRLFPDQIEYILNHAEDRLVFVDPLFVPLLEQMQAALSGVEAFIVLCGLADMPATELRNAVCYDAWIESESDTYDWPELDENAACSMCYTSGTTGNPKGVLFSHRSTVLHSYGLAMPDVMGLRERDCVFPLAPMFHVNAWGTPYVVPMVGAKLVLAGPRMADGAILHRLIEGERVSFACGVPTIWLALLAWLNDNAERVDCLERVCVGGAACPAAIMDEFRDRYDVRCHHAWGMTEMSPVGTYNEAKACMDGWPTERLRAHQLKQGRGVFGVEMKIVDDDGKELSHNGETFGALRVRGPWVCRAYYNEDAPATDEEGWFDTGDVATIDGEGYLQIVDRSKDVIKSGGEWISSIELENTAANHPDVAEAAVIGRPHPKWQERPLLIVVPRPESTLDRNAMLTWFDGKVARWWIPNDVVFVDELPHTATGKIRKTDLRRQFADYACAEV